jgi:hypothetical protein
MHRPTVDCAEIQLDLLDDAVVPAVAALPVRRKAGAAALTCSGFFEPIIPGGRLGWGWVDVAA